MQEKGVDSRVEVSFCVDVSAVEPSSFKHDCEAQGQKGVVSVRGRWR